MLVSKQLCNNLPVPVPHSKLLLRISRLLGDEVALFLCNTSQSQQLEVFGESPELGLREVTEALRVELRKDSLILLPCQRCHSWVWGRPVPWAGIVPQFP